MRSLRIDGETDDDFRERAKRAAAIAKVLVEACLVNDCMRRLIEDPTMSYTAESVRRSPVVRVEYEQAIAIGSIGETVEATKSKHWGEGPWIRPLKADDEFFPDHITYVYRKNSLYNRRFEQRRRLKELLGKKHRSLVELAKNSYMTKHLFLRDLREDQAWAIRHILNVEPDEFWRACKGKQFLNLPTRLIQLVMFEDL